MNLEQSLRAYLIDSSELTALVGKRIYPVIAPQLTEEPYIIYQVISATSEGMLSGTTGIRPTLVQVDVYGKTFGEVIDIRDVLFILLDNIKYSVKQATSPITTEEWISLFENMRQGYESDTKLYRVSLDLRIYRSQSA